MKSYTAPPPQNSTTDYAHFAQSVVTALNNSPSIVDSVRILYESIQKYIPCDYILETFATNDNYEHKECFFIHPNISTKGITLNSAPEQLESLRFAPNPVIHVGDENDFGTTFDLVRRIFPQTKYNALTLRIIIRDRLLYSLTLVQTRTLRSFTDSHVDSIFAIADHISSYFDNQDIFNSINTSIKQFDRFLPLVYLPDMAGVAHRVWQVARQRCPVLLLGESGTGKEAVSLALYRASRRLGAPFIKINCGGLPDSLIDSELFGFERGAFTGAIQTRKGIFERANKGVLLLDEVGELSAPAQTKLLRVLQEGVLERVGGSQEQHVDVRVIASTHRNLEAMYKFRLDLTVTPFGRALSD